MFLKQPTVLEKISVHCEPQNQEKIKKIGSPLGNELRSAHLAGCPDTKWAPGRATSVCRCLREYSAVSTLASSSQSVPSHVRQSLTMKNLLITDSQPAFCTLLQPLRRQEWWTQECNCSHTRVPSRMQCIIFVELSTCIVYTQSVQINN